MRPTDDRLARGFFGDVKVAQHANQRRQYPAGVGQVDGIHRLVHWIGRRHGDRSHHLPAAGARTYAGCSVLTIHGMPNRSTAMRGTWSFAGVSRCVSIATILPPRTMSNW